MNPHVPAFNKFVPAVQATSVIVCCTPNRDRWMGLAAELDEKPRQWHIVEDRSKVWLKQGLRLADCSSLWAGWQAVQQVKRLQADLLISDGPVLSFWCAVFAALYRVEVHHVAHSFHFPQLPNGVGYWLMQWAYPKIHRFTVHSRAEKQFYSEHFGIAIARFEMVHWGTVKQNLVHHKPLLPGEYVCAISNHPLDYPILMAAMATLPHIPLVIVGAGYPWRFTAPPNVSFQSRGTPTSVMNLLQYSRFLVLPQGRSRLPCDHQTLVMAMHLGKALVVPDFPSASDYAFQNSNAILYQPGKPDALADAIDDLWKNLIKCEVLGQNGKGFAETFCSQESLRKYVRQILIRRGL